MENTAHPSDSTRPDLSRAHLLMLTAVTTTCGDCGAERIFMPVDESARTGEFCCTACDAAVFLLGVAEAPAGPLRPRSRVA
jgi:hypothetical protein